MNMLTIQYNNIIIHNRYCIVVDLTIETVVSHNNYVIKIIITSIIIQLQVINDNYDNKCTGVQNPRTTSTITTDTRTIKHNTTN